MIEIINDIISRLTSIQGFSGRVYRIWPQSKVNYPAAIVSRVSGATRLSDADGTEIQAQLTYSIDIVCASQKDADSLAEEVSDMLAGLNLHRTGTMDMYDDQLRMFRTIVTVSGIIDIRGNTFTGGY